MPNSSNKHLRDFLLSDFSSGSITHINFKLKIICLCDKYSFSDHLNFLVNMILKSSLMTKCNVYGDIFLPTDTKAI